MFYWTHCRQTGHAQEHSERGGERDFLSSHPIHVWMTSFLKHKSYWLVHELVWNSVRAYYTHPSRWYIIFVNSYTDFKRAVQTVFGTLSENCFSQMYVKCVRRHEKCITAKGEYFEKKWKNVITLFRSKCPARKMVYDLYVFLNMFYVCQLCKI